MQRDKATLEYRGETQLARVHTLVAAVAERAFISVRRDQIADASRRDLPQIVDAVDLEGPVAGILSAQQRFPEVAWLVVACDLPFLDRDTLEHLLRARDPARVATAYRSSHDSLPEPLCAIWEPASHAALSRFVVERKNCPRRFLIESGPLLLEPLTPGALDNVNTPDEYAAATRALLLGAAS
jgi:molybdopterin-guanine dinucleotide biosynthesis protein A